jgi:superoxide reductase
MRLMDAKKEEQGKEKHLPVVEKEGTMVKIRVGSTLHPMEEQHHIEWIEVMADGAVYRKQLRPGEKAEAEFVVNGKLVARAYCNVHGLWAVEWEG